MRKSREFQENMSERSPIYFMVVFVFIVLSISIVALVWDAYLNKDMEKHNRDFEKERLIDVY